MNFSQRIGKQEVKTILQKETIDEELKIKLWNIFYNSFYLFYKKDYWSNLEEFSKVLWRDFFLKRANLFKDSDYVIMIFLQNWFFEVAEWNEIYDFIERVVDYEKYWKNEYYQSKQTEFTDKCNYILEKQLSAYRIFNCQITPISNEIEIESLKNALKNNDRFEEVSTHLNTSISYLSNRENPDYRNSIKESISAVESICKIITGEKTLGKALNNLEKNGIRIHPNMKSAFDKLYAYTNDPKTGIRHAFIDGDYSPDFDEAKFMLVTCSTFINYVKSKVV